MTTDRPVPVPDEGSSPYWEAAARGVLVLPRCSSCGAFSIPPEPVCPRCHSADPVWAFDPVSGRGAVRSWTVVRQPFLPGIEVPFVLVDVEVAEQADLRLIGQLVDGPEAPIHVGAAVATEFDERTPEIAVPVFRLAARP